MNEYGNYDDTYGDAGETNLPDNFMEKNPEDGRIISGVNPKFSETFSSEDITEQTNTQKKPNKPKNCLKSLIVGFGNERVWTVQCWRTTSEDAPKSLWPSQTHHGLTYQQALNKKREIINREGNNLISVEIVVRVNDHA